MRKIKCYECGRIYNFDVDDFCPRCGAFNQPLRTTRVAADGTVVRNDGLNESNHEGSFVHAELHEENKARKRTGLDKDLARRKPVPAKPVAKPAASSANAGKKQTLATAGITGVIGWIVLIFILRIFMDILF